MAVSVQHNDDASRFEAEVAGGLAHLDYNRFNEGIVLAHTKVPKQSERQGVGGELVKAAVEWARSADMRVIATCPFVRAYLQRHPEMANVVR